MNKLYRAIVIPLMIMLLLFPNTSFASTAEMPMLLNNVNNLLLGKNISTVSDEELTELAEMSTSQLEKIGYSEEEIQVLRMRHIERVMDTDKTYSGFIGNDEMLSYEELCLLPGTYIENEFDVLEDMKEKPISELQQMGVATQDINALKKNSC